LIDELRSKEKMARLQDTLMRKEQQLNDVRTRMCDELTKRDEQISQLEEQNGRLQAFSDAVRQTFVYRVYRFAKRVKRE
jgi:DNA anti-recombination protein RmuC